MPLQVILRNQVIFLRKIKAKVNETKWNQKDSALKYKLDIKSTVKFFSIKLIYFFFLFLKMQPCVDSLTKTPFKDILDKYDSFFFDCDGVLVYFFIVWQSYPV